jgi:hypothetical protein
LSTAGFTQILLDIGAILKSDFAVFDDLLTLAFEAMHQLKSNHCYNFSRHPLEDQCLVLKAKSLNFPQY